MSDDVSPTMREVGDRLRAGEDVELADLIPHTAGDVREYGTDVAGAASPLLADGPVHGGLPGRARTRPPGDAPGRAAARTATATSAWRSIPVSTPMRRNIHAASSVAVFPVAPGAKGQPPRPANAVSNPVIPARQAAAMLASA